MGPGAPALAMGVQQHYKVSTTARLGSGATVPPGPRWDLLLRLDPSLLPEYTDIQAQMQAVFALGLQNTKTVGLV